MNSVSLARYNNVQSIHWAARLALLAVTIFARGATAADRAVPARFPVPSSSALAASQKTINEVFEADLADTSPRAQLKLALRMLNDAAKTNDDLAGKYALLLKSRDLAIDAADLQTAFDAVNALAASFSIDAPALGRDTLVKIASKLDTPEERSLLADYAIYVLGQFAREDRYGELASLYPLLRNAAALSASAETRARVALALSQLQAAADEFQMIKPAMETLARNPGDPEANNTAGRFYFIFGVDSAKGLLLLSKGTGTETSNPWKALATREVANPQSPDQQAALAEDWWTLAEQQSGLTRERIESHAAQWYRRALPGLSGLARAVAQKRLDAAPPAAFELDRTPPRHEIAMTPPPTPPPAPPPAKPDLHIVILSARWGGGRHWSDVTDKVRELFVAQDTFTVNPSTLDADPTPGWRKRLEIVYTKDGIRRRLIRNEEQKLDPTSLED